MASKLRLTGDTAHFGDPIEPFLHMAFLDLVEEQASNGPVKIFPLVSMLILADARRDFRTLLTERIPGK